MASVFVTGVKSEIQIHENLLSQNSKNPKSAKLNYHKNSMPHGKQKNIKTLCCSYVYAYVTVMSSGDMLA